MKDNNIKSGAEVMEIVIPTNKELEFKELAYSKSDRIGDKTISISERDENDYIHIDCIKGKKQIRTSIGIEDNETSFSLVISIGGKNVSDKKTAKLASKIINVVKCNHNDEPTPRRITNKIVDVITLMKEIDL